MGLSRALYDWKDYGKEWEVVYEHKAKPVRVYSKAAATIMQSLMRGGWVQGKARRLSNLCLAQINSAAG